MVSLVVDAVVAAGAVHIQGFKGIAVTQTPGDDPLHSVHAEASGIVLQHHGIGAVADALDHIFKHLVCRSCPAGIIGIHVPIEILAQRTVLC